MEPIKVLQFDPKMTNPENRCKDTHIPEKGQNWFRPDYSPFYEEHFRAYDHRGEELGKDDYELVGYDPLLTVRTFAGSVFRFVRTKREFPEGITFDYRSVGIHGAPLSRIDKIKDDLEHNKNPIDWEHDVIGFPGSVPGIDHYHDVTKEIAGFDIFIGFFSNLTAHYQFNTLSHYFGNQQAIIDEVNYFNEQRKALYDRITAHDLDFKDPHKVTKVLLRRELVENYPLAPIDVDAKAVSFEHYSTPAGLSGFMQTRNSVSPIFIRPGHLPIDSHFNNDYTQNVTLISRRPTVRQAGGYWRAVPGGGLVLLRGYDVTSQNKILWTHIKPDGEIVDTYRFAEMEDGQECINCPDGSVKFYRDNNTWYARITQNGKLYRIDDITLPVTSDWKENTNVFFYKEVIYLLHRVSEEGSPDEIHLYRGNTLGRPSGAVVRFNFLNIDFMDDTKHLHRNVKEFPLFHAEMNEDEPFHFDYWGSPLTVPCQVAPTGKAIMFLDRDPSNSLMIIKLFQVVVYTRGDKVRSRVLEKSFLFDLEKGYIEPNYETQARLNLPFNINATDEELIDQADPEVEDAIIRLSTSPVGSAASILSKGKVIWLGKNDQSYVFELPYSGRLELLARPWLKFLTKDEVVQVKNQNTFITSESTWEITVPTATYTFINGVRIPVEPMVIDVKPAYEDYPVDTLWLYVGNQSGKAEYFIHQSSELERSGLILIAELMMSKSGVKGVILQTNENEEDE